MTVVVSSGWNPCGCGCYNPCGCPPNGGGSAEVPDSPTNLVATPDEGAISLDWDAVSGATSYTVLRAENAGGPYYTTIAEEITATNAVDSDVSTGITYYYVVIATNAQGSSGYSNEDSATPLAPVQTKATFWGRSPSAHLTNEAEVEALSTHDDDDYRSSYDCGTAGAPNFCFLAWPAAFGGPNPATNPIMFGSLQASMAQPGSATPFGTSQVPPGSGYWVETVTVNGESYYIYRLSLETAGGVTLTVS
jgi:hypothetical protein